MKVKKTYRLEEETIRELEKLCEATGKTATEVIELPYAMPYASHTTRAAPTASVTGGRRRWPRSRNSLL